MEKIIKKLLIIGCGKLGQATGKVLTKLPLEVIGITTVYGNVPVKLATKNALILSELSQSKTPVFSGKEKPLEREIKQFPNFIHGHDGLGNIKHESPKLKMSDKTASDFIAGSINDYPGEIDIIAVGPLTNIAASAIEYPEIIKKVKPFGEKTFNIELNPSFWSELDRCVNSTIELSKSSPPKNVSPLVDLTSNTPSPNSNIETSKVPPPKSYTAIFLFVFLSKP